MQRVCFPTNGASVGTCTGSYFEPAHLGDKARYALARMATGRAPDPSRRYGMRGKHTPFKARDDERPREEAHQ